jgi:hypothetical protein
LAALWLYAFAIAGLAADDLYAQDGQREIQRISRDDALSFCRGLVTRPIALHENRRILCVDGLLFHEFDFLPGLTLEPGAYVVVRGLGGNVAAVLQLAELIEYTRATVIVRDYCFAACANYLLIAGAQTIVPDDAIVAWNLSRGANDCFAFVDSGNRTAPWFVNECTSGSGQLARDPLSARKKRFYARRTFDNLFEEPPQSVAVRRILKRKFDQTGVYPREFFWTWNPRNYASVYKTKMDYEAYPKSQDELNALLEKLQISYPVIYDP